MQQCMKLSLTNRSKGLIPFRLAPPGGRIIPSRPVMNIPDALPKGQSCRLGPSHATASRKGSGGQEGPKLPDQCPKALVE